jgi:membrane protein
MTQWSNRLLTVLRAIVHEARTERLTFMAGSIAYSAFVSLLPLLLLLVTAVSAIGDTQLETALLSVTTDAVTPEAGKLLVNDVRAASIEVSVLGIGILVWGALRIFRSLDAAFSDIYETTDRNTLADRVLDSAIVLCSLVLLVLLTLLVTHQVAPAVGTFGSWFGQQLVLVCGLSLALLPMYLLFPDEPEMLVREAVPGTVCAAVGLVGAKLLFQWYLAFSVTAQRESIVASILVLLTWLYASGFVILFGAAVNAVLSNRSADVHIRPVIGGADTTPETTPRALNSSVAVGQPVSLDRPGIHPSEDSTGVPHHYLLSLPSKHSGAAPASTVTERQENAHDLQSCG